MDSQWTKRKFKAMDEGHNIVINGKSIEPRVTCNSLAELDDRYGIDVFAVFQSMNRKAVEQGIDLNDPEQAAKLEFSIGPKIIRGLLWAAIRPSVHNYTIDQAGNYIEKNIQELGGFEGLSALVMGALMKCGLFKQPEVETKGEAEEAAPLDIASGG